MKKFLKISYWVLICAGIVASFAFSQKASEEIRINKIKVLIDEESGNFFLKPEDITKQLQQVGIKTHTYGAGEIDFKAIERIIEVNPSVKTAHVYHAYDGTFVVKITQRRPILRVYNNYGESFYIDNEGTLMPLSLGYTARVPIASGAINIPYSSFASLNPSDLQHALQTWPNAPNRNYYKQQENQLSADSLKAFNQLKELYDLATFLDKNEFWSAQITQIYRKSNGDFVLIPLVGIHDILLGNTQFLNEKFNKLMTFYQKGLSLTGWNEYSRINLKFNNQIICTKKHV
jgi:cell division protein FtsQ